MKKIASIMVATDMSTCAVMAEKRAALLCRQLGVDTLDIINVQDLSVIDMLTRALKSPTDETKRVVREGLAADLENITKRLEEAYGINSRLVIRFGKPAHEITTRVIGEKTGLLVVGAHGNDPGSDMFLGNLPSKLLQFNPCPLLIVRKAPTAEYRKIIVAVDFSEISLYLAQQALAIATPETEIVLVHAYEVPNEGMMRYASVSEGLLHEFRSNIRLKSGAEMQDFISQLDVPNPITPVIQFGVPSVVLKENIETKKPDLIVMGKHGRTRLEEFLLGSTTRNTINETDCDILVVPPAAIDRDLGLAGKGI